MPFWKAKIENPSPKVARQLRSIIISQQGERLVTRLNFADGSFSDVDSNRMPRFDLGEILKLEIHEETEVSTAAAAPPDA